MIQSAPLTPEDQAWIANIFKDWNAEQGFDGGYENFCFEHSIDGEKQGIIHGKFFGGWCAVTDLAVKREARGQGIGKALIQHVEEVAQQKGMQGMYLTTLSIQAPKFYEALGYINYAELKPFAGDNKKLFYKKVF